MITLHLRAPLGDATCTSLPSDHGQIELDALTDALVAKSSASTIPILAIERASSGANGEYLVRHIDDRLVRKGRAKIHVGGRALSLKESILVREGVVIRVNAWTVRIGKARLPIAPSSQDIEESFLASLRRHPDDHELRVVYADWLEENGAHSAAEMLRLDVRLANATDSKERAAVTKALQAVARDVEDDWRAEVARPKIEACKHEPSPEGELAFEFECPKDWQKLDRRPDPKVRFCNSCRKEVTYCATIDEARSIATNGGCVAVDPSLTRSKDDLKPRRLVLTHRMGMVCCFKV